MIAFIPISFLFVNGIIFISAPLRILALSSRISLEALSLTNALNKKVSYLVTDQTPAAFHGLGPWSSLHAQIPSLTIRRIQ